MTRRLTTVLVIAAALAGLEYAQAASARSLVKEGNAAYREGNYDEALKSYEQAGEQEPDSGRIHFNKGAALYQQGDYSKALDEFEKAAVAGNAAGDREFEARAKYNAGNSLFRQGEKQQTTAPRGAVDSLNRSVEAYRRAIQLNPALADAAHNLEVARLQIKRLLDQARQTPQGNQNQSNAQDQDLSEQLQELLEQQQQASREGEKLSQQQQQLGNSQGLQDRTQQLSREQQEIQQQTEQLAQQLQQQQPESQQPQQQVRQQLDQAAGHQQQAQEKLQQQQLSGAGEDRKKAEEALRQALQQSQGQPGSQEPQQQAQAPEQQQSEGSAGSSEGEQQPTGEGVEAPNEEARDILDQERANRKQRQLRQMGGTRPVEKDW